MNKACPAIAKSVGGYIFHQNIIRQTSISDVAKM
jgi:hypothetical protein